MVDARSDAAGTKRPLKERNHDLNDQTIGLTFCLVMTATLLQTLSNNQSPFEAIKPVEEVVHRSIFSHHMMSLWSSIIALPFPLTPFLTLPLLLLLLLLLVVVLCM